MQNSKLTVTGSTGVQKAFGLQIPLVAGVPQGIQDGQTFTINRGSGAITFELDTNNNVLSGNIPVRFSSSASAAQIGAALVTAISNSNVGLSPVYDGEGVVRLGGDANTVLGLSQTALTQVGIAGQPASVRIAVPATAAASQVAPLIRTAIESVNLSGIVVTTFGSRLIVANATAVSGVGAGVIGAIRDLAGNTLKANQVDGSTTLTVFLGDGLDYGDAPSPYKSTEAQGGPTHKVVTGLSLGATVTADVDARLINADTDDGVTFSALYGAFGSSAQISVTNTLGATGFVKMWIDFNGDGVFANSGVNSEVITSFSIIGSGTRTVSFTVPAGSKVGQTYARVRLSTESADVASPEGAAVNGEVEDHLVNLQSNPFTNGTWNLDVSGDGFVSPVDALKVINWLNDPAKPKLLTLADATFAPPYIDVNGDGRVTASDALLVINYLNSRPATGEGEGEGEGDSALASLYGSNQQTVLASNWAASLFSSASNPGASASAPQVVNDAFFASDDLVDAPATSWQGGSEADHLWAQIGADSTDESVVGSLDDDILNNILA